MQVEVKVPQLSESVSEATLVAWHKKIGEAVKRDENLIDIETDKVVLELPAPADGVLTKIIKADGGTVGSGEVIAVIDTEAKASVAAAPAAAPAKAAAPAPAPAPAAPAPVAAAAPAGKSASPSAAKIAAEKGIDTASVPGSGRDGRVTKGDVLTAGSAPAPTPAAAKPASIPVQMPSGSRTEQRVPMSRLRARIAERLVQSQSTAAILTTFNEVNMAPVIDLRTRYKDKFEKEHGVKLGFMSFFVKAAVHALKKYPVVNASVDGNDIVYHGYFDIGIAVGTERGLVVPILRDADQLSIAQIEQSIADFGKRAKEGKLAIEELTGGTFSITNGGVFGSMFSTPIINPPQSAILGVHATKDRAVVENGQVVVRPMNYLALSYDHRIIDGREAVLSLVAMKEALEDPARLILDV
ncbi:2-oxoglutarate dehydrogenase complex dihydrolipoyllysine-residue succinyltransferase [Usitatibacter palustris]|uniref:Dihydrolipoyllysine-residue succinyltransferase component of 2-oxoglutarate dehydrogenase complex n=1 Tax=Usitatibacter palustris TaxID=2732487 RepID=A0A6M4H5G1_9PROT|nr:2-oxoglutarate dehydrogenase complex dihydrolipoyllysine-residue succinyltransferase [Usitatibacter palustris]QJR14899.1 Dihydrolipoyllysine-residue succinyltransferase component of 2-oxoglutarate dehydrogenase complex [Usitatibacter palustris]